MVRSVMSWQVLALVNVVLGSAIVPMQRVLLRRPDSSPLPFVLVSQTLTGALLLPLAIRGGIRVLDLTREWPAIALMFSLYAAGHVLYAATLRTVEASVFSTLLRTSTAWVVATGYVVFDEQVRLLDLLGTTLVLVSILLLVEWRGGPASNRGVCLGLAVGAVFGVASSAWVYVGRDADLVTWTAVSFIGTPALVALLRPRAIPEAMTLLRRDGVAMLPLAVFWAASNLASLAAFQRGPASLVAPVQATGVVVAAVLAIVVLGERERIPRKLGAAVVSCVGVVVVVT